MEGLNFITVPIIVTIVYVGITILKKATSYNEKVLRILPIIASVLGAVLGVIAFFTLPQIIPAGDVFAAILVGGASGLAATGTNQIFKQLGKKDEEDKSDDDKQG